MEGGLLVPSTPSAKAGGAPVDAPRNLPISLTNRNLPKIGPVTGRPRPKAQRRLPGGRWVGKQFHTAEASFRRRVLLGLAFRSGRENFSPSKWQSADRVLRSALARRLREAFGSELSAASGALGISNRICVLAAKPRRTASSIPPALTLRAVANSRNSFPLPSRLRTKTGMAKGNLGHFRLSVCLLLERTPPPCNKAHQPRGSTLVANAG